MARKSVTTPLTPANARARLLEAHAYISAAEILDGGTPAENKVAGSNAILAGIAAADAICGLVLGERSSGDDHTQAITLLKRATSPSTKAANSLRRLLTEKTPVQYGADAVNSADLAALLNWARDVIREADEKAR